MAGSGVALGGVVLAAAGLQSLGNSLSPLPAPRRADDHSLITTGVYQYARCALLPAELTLFLDQET